ncbi:MAG: hypothetical protein AB1324_02645 [Candidatus Micrarchaeota archaeon]
MKLIRKAELIEYHDKEQCRIRGANAPLIGARYEAWFTKGEGRFHVKGRYPEVEGLMIREDASPFFYRMLVRLAGKIGDMKGSRLDVSDAGVRCIASLSMWSQDMVALSAITGLGAEQVKLTASELCREGYLRPVGRHGMTRMVLTAKGWRAENDFVGDDIRDELLSRTIEIYTLREIESLRAGRPHI